MRTTLEAILNSLNNVSRGKQRGGVGGHNWGKNCIGLFHVSEHLGHFKATKNFTSKRSEMVWFGGTSPPVW